MRMPNRLRGMITSAILLLILASYLITNTPQVQQVLAKAATLPLYRTSSNNVCLITANQDTAETLLQMAKNAAAAGVTLTIAVPVETLDASPMHIAQIAALGHCIVLYGMPKEQGETSEQWIERTYQANCRLETVIGTKCALYMPYLGQYTKDALRLCAQHNLRCLLYCKDSRTYAAKTQAAFAKALSDKAEKGDIIYIAADENTDFVAIAKCFALRELQFGTMGSLFD